MAESGVESGKPATLGVMLDLDANDAYPRQLVLLVYRICRLRKICVIEKAERDRDKLGPAVDAIYHCRSAVRAKSIGHLSTAFGDPHKLPPASLNIYGVDWKAELSRKSAARPALTGLAMTDGHSQRLTRAIHPEVAATA